MATGLEIEGVTLAIIIGVLAAIVYSLRVLMLLERRIARMDMNLLRLTEKVSWPGMRLRPPMRRALQSFSWKYRDSRFARIRSYPS